MSDATPSWRIAGAYFESCNCDAICPCRTIGGRPGGRSTYGLCFGVLSWRIDEGHVGSVSLAGLNAALVIRYHDDEPGSPWRFNVHVDERGDERQQAALTDLLTGKLGGKSVLGLPWLRKPSELLEIKTSRVEIVHSGADHELRIGDSIELRASRPVETSEVVSCVIPGHHQPGTELYADMLVVQDGPFEWELTDRCAFVSDFDYRSDEAA
jgi:hypothetical protein